MTHALISTTQPTEQTTTTTCSQCPYFKDYQDSRRRGLCYVFDQVSYQHWQRSSDCERAIEALEQECQTIDSEQSIPVMVELATKEIEDDGTGHAVPVDVVQTLVTVSRLATEMVLAAATAKGYYEGYVLKDWWQPSAEEEWQEF